MYTATIIIKNEIMNLCGEHKRSWMGEREGWEYFECSALRNLFLLNFIIHKKWILMIHYVWFLMNVYLTWTLLSFINLQMNTFFFLHLGNLGLFYYHTSRSSPSFHILKVLWHVYRYLCVKATHQIFFLDNPVGQIWLFCL